MGDSVHRERILLDLCTSSEASEANDACVMDRDFDSGSETAELFPETSHCSPGRREGPGRQREAAYVTIGSLGRRVALL